MKIVIDENISFAEDAFSQFGNIELLPGRSIDNNILTDADILIIRSVTNVTEELLQNTNVEFVGTATIGTDHVDTEYLDKAGIKFSSAAGCNSDAVAEYVLTALSKVTHDKKLRFRDLTIGIVGVGNIGGRLAKYCSYLGMKVLKNDPPLKRKTGDSEYLKLDELMNADIISLHVPLNQDEDRTFHLFDGKQLDKIKDGAVIFNTSRGPVIDNNELLNTIDRKDLTVVLDVWENEPLINTNLLKKCFIASPHIAGYSLEGKVNGTLMIYHSLCEFLKQEKKWKPSLPPVSGSIFKLNNDSMSLEQIFYSISSTIYQIENEKKHMLKMLDIDTFKRKLYFDSMRKNYDLRREFNNYTLQVNNKDTAEFLKKFRFKVS